MSEAHDNTIPARKGSYNISKAGIVYYFPIEEPGFLKPFMALMLLRRADDEIYCAIDEQWLPLQGFGPDP